MTDTQQVWLTRNGYERLKEELLWLVKERAGEAPQDGQSGVSSVARNGSDEDSVADRRERDQRIRKLQEMLQDPIVGGAPLETPVTRSNPNGAWC